MEKLLLIAVIAAVFIGPQHLPKLAAGAARAVDAARNFLRGAKARAKEELGDDFDFEELRKYDPRQYDPRRVIRDTLFEEDAPVATAAPRPERPAPVVHTDASDLPPFDSEAT